MAIRAPDGAKNSHILPTGQWYAPSAVIDDACYFMVLQGIALYCMVLHGIAYLITADGAYHCPVGSIWPFFPFESWSAP